MNEFNTDLDAHKRLVVVESNVNEHARVLSEHSARLDELKLVHKRLFVANGEPPLVVEIKTLSQSLADHIRADAEARKEVKSFKDRWFWWMMSLVGTGILGYLLREMMVKLVAK